MPFLKGSTLNTCIPSIWTLVIKFLFLMINDIVWKYSELWSFWVKFLHLEYCLQSWHFLILHVLDLAWKEDNYCNSSSFNCLISPNLSSLCNSSSSGCIFLSILLKEFLFHNLRGSINSFRFLYTCHLVALAHSSFTNFLNFGWVNHTFIFRKGLGP